MKRCAIVFILAFVYCVSESDGLKILKKLKDLLHPTTVPTTTVVPTLPQYEKQPYDQDDDSKSWEQESSTSKVKPENSKEDISNSQSTEDDRDKFTILKKKYNNIKPDKTKPLNGGDFNSNSPMTSTNSDDIKYSSNNDQFSSQNNFNNQGFQTTTKKYDQSNSENYPGQPSNTDSFSNQGIKPNTPISPDLYDQNQPQKSFDGFDNQITPNTPPTTFENTNYNEVQPGIPSHNNNTDSAYVPTSTSVAPDKYSGTSLQEENQDKYTSGQQPSFSSPKETNQNNTYGGTIVFPDDTSLDPTPEPERSYTHTNSNDNNEKDLHKTTPAPVNGGRRIIDGPLKECGPGQIYDKNKNICKDLARK